MARILLYLACLLVLTITVIALDEPSMTGSSVYYPLTGILFNRVTVSQLPPRDSRYYDDIRMVSRSVGNLEFRRSYVLLTSVTENSVTGDKHGPYRSTLHFGAPRISTELEQDSIFTVIHYGGKNKRDISEKAEFELLYEVYYQKKTTDIKDAFPITIASDDDELSIARPEIHLLPKGDSEWNPFEFILQLKPSIPLQDVQSMTVKMEYGYYSFLGSFEECTINQDPVKGVFDYQQQLLTLETKEFDFKSNRTLTITCNDGHLASGEINFSLFKISYHVGGGGDDDPTPDGGAIVDNEDHHTDEMIQSSNHHHILQSLASTSSISSTAVVTEEAQPPPSSLRQTQQQETIYTTYAIIEQTTKRSTFVFVVLIVIASILGLGAVVIILCHKRISCLNPDRETDNDNAVMY